jgi:hypothetical protein
MTPFLAAYPGQARPVDSTVAMASLRLHDRLGREKYAATAVRWVAGAKARLDPATGLLPAYGRRRHRRTHGRRPR